MTCSLDEVYEKFKHLDVALSDPEWCKAGSGPAWMIAEELWQAIKGARENPCEENGCTDIENCDEICQHSRIYSQVQMQQAIALAKAAENKRVLDELATMYSNVPERFLHGTYRLNPEWVDKINSLRLAQPEPTEGK